MLLIRCHTFLQIEDALEQFLGQQGKPFLFLHCWYVLRNTRKWQDWISGKGEDTIASTEPAGSASGDQVDSPPSQPGRPIGRDAAKKCRNDQGGSSSSSGCLEIFQKMAMNREMKTQQDAVWAAEQKEARDRQLALQEEQNIIQREQTRISREQWEWTKFQDENKIMLMDLTNCTDVAKEYFIGLQHEILARRHRGGGTSAFRPGTSVDN